MQWCTLILWYLEEKSVYGLDNDISEHLSKGEKKCAKTKVGQKKKSKEGAEVDQHR